MSNLFNKHLHTPEMLNDIQKYNDYIISSINSGRLADIDNFRIDLANFVSKLSSIGNIAPSLLFQDIENVTGKSPKYEGYTLSDNYSEYLIDEIFSSKNAFDALLNFNPSRKDIIVNYKKIKSAKEVVTPNLYGHKSNSLFSLKLLKEEYKKIGTTQSISSIENINFLDTLYLFSKFFRDEVIATYPRLSDAAKSLNHAVLGKEIADLFEKYNRVGYGVANANYLPYGIEELHCLEHYRNNKNNTLSFEFLKEISCESILPISTYKPPYVPYYSVGTHDKCRNNYQRLEYFCNILEKNKDNEAFDNIIFKYRVLTYYNIILYSKDFKAYKFADSYLSRCSHSINGGKKKALNSLTDNIVSGSGASLKMQKYLQSPESLNHLEKVLDNYNSAKKSIYKLQSFKRIINLYPDVLYLDKTKEELLIRILEKSENKDILEGIQKTLDLLRIHKSLKFVDLSIENITAISKSPALFRALFLKSYDDKKIRTAIVEWTLSDAVDENIKISSLLSGISFNNEEDLNLFYNINIDKMEDHHILALLSKYDYSQAPFLVQFIDKLNANLKSKFLKLLDKANE